MKTLFTIFLFSSAVSRIASSQLRCLRDFDNSSHLCNEIDLINTTHPSYPTIPVNNRYNGSSCVLFKYHDTDEIKFSCEVNDECSTGSKREFCFGGRWGSLYCCSTDNCNNASDSNVNQFLKSRLMCHSNRKSDFHLIPDFTGYYWEADLGGGQVSCDMDHCFNSTVFAADGETIVRVEHGCLNETECSDEKKTFNEIDKCTNTTLSNSQIQRYCTCSTDLCNIGPPVEAVINPENTESSIKQKQSAMVGTIIGALIIVAVGLVLTGFGVKKCYDHRRNKRLEYSYAQLTADIADELDDDDDRLILP